MQRCIIFQFILVLNFLKIQTFLKLIFKKILRLKKVIKPCFNYIFILAIRFHFKVQKHFIFVLIRFFI